MNRLLIKKAMHESGLLFIACASMLFVFCLTRVWIVCQFDLQKFQPLLEQLRPFEKFLPVPLEQLLTYTGSLAMTFNEPVLMLCILVWCIARGSDVVSGEINRGTLEMLLAQPLTRGQLLWSHAVVCSAGLALLCFTVWAGLAIGIHTNTVREQVAPSVDVPIPFTSLRIPVPLGATRQVETPLSSYVDATLLVAPSCQLFALGFFVYGLSVLCSSFDRYRWRTLGIVIGIYIVQLLILLLSRAAAGLKWVGYFSFLSAYQPDAIVHFTKDSPYDAWWLITPVARRSTSWPHGLGPMGLTCLLLILGILFLIVAHWRFRTRDIPAPL